MATQFSWSRLLENFRTKHPNLYRAWFDELPPAEIEGGELRVQVDRPAPAHYLRTVCTAPLTDEAIALTGHLVSIRFICAAEEDAPILGVSSPAQFVEIPLNPDYTFDHFVVGASNRFVHAACRAVCSEAQSPYNPLYIHGHSGLGKTHLLQAVCAALRERHPPRRAIYVSCETFVNELVRAIASGRLPEFRDDIRRADALIIDDIQFLAGRESSQEELFHTFNALHQSRRQIVLSGDSPPGEIPTLEERLVSRFAGGLVAPIGPPERETRHAILQKKARMRGADIPNDVLDLIAEHVHSNIRALEGALTTVIEQASLEGTTLDVESARSMLPLLQPKLQRQLHVSDILDAVSKHFNVRVADLVGRKRIRSHSQPRQAAMFLARKLTSMSLEEIGNSFGGRDHSTVLYAERTIESECRHDAEMAHAIAHLTRILQQRRQ